MPRIWLRAFRDLWAMRGRAVAAILIIAFGVGLSAGVLLSSVVLLDSVRATWDRLHLADYTLGYAPTLASEVPDVRQIDWITATRDELVIQGRVALADGTTLPAVIYGTRFNVASDTPNQLEISGGMPPGPRERGLVAERALATFHGVKPGDRVAIELAGARYGFDVVATALSPEYLVASSNPQFLVPVKGSLAVVYMPLSTLQELVGAPIVNRTVVNANRSPSIAERADLRQWFADSGIAVEEFAPKAETFGVRFLERHVRSFASFLPPMVIVFAMVSIVALFVTANRMVVLQRTQIGALRAMGYGRGTLALTFGATGLALGVIGSGLGIGLGAAMSMGIAWQYANAVGLPEITWVWTPLISLGAAAAGIALSTVAVAAPALRAGSIQPREALANYRPASAFPDAIGNVVDRLTGAGPFTFRLGMRNLTRRPLSVTTTVIGVALALGLAACWLMLIRTMNESVYEFFDNASWEHQVDLRRPLPLDQAADILRDAGAGGTPILPIWAQLRTARSSEYFSVVGIDVSSSVVADDLLTSVPVPGERSLVMTKFAMERLGLRLGDEVELALGQTVERVKIGGTMRSLIGDRAFVSLGVAQRLMRRPGQVSGFVTPGLSAETIGRLVENPLVATVMSKQLAVDGFRSFQDQMMGTVYTAVAMSVLTALVVIWSSLAVTLLEREPEFATMRARGFGRRELTAVVSTEVIAQLAIGLVLAIPVALGIVFPLTQQLAQALQTSLEPFIAPQDYLFGMLPALILMPVVVQWGIRRLMSLNIGLTVKRSISV